MKNERELSARFNMSLGFMPVIITMLSAEFMPTDWAVYMGAAVGILFSAFYYIIYKSRTFHFILFSNTSILVIFSCVVFIVGTQNEWAHQLLPLTLEITVLFPLLILFLNRKRYTRISCKNETIDSLKEQMRVTMLTFSCIRIFFGLIILHFAFITVGLILTRSLDNSFMRFTLHVAPIIVLIASVIVGQIEIKILQAVDPPEFVPVVTPQGKVIGKVDKNLADEYKNEHTHPIVRIAVVNHDMLFLAKSSMQRVIDKGKVDIPLETYLLFKEDIKSGVERLLKEAFPQTWQHLNPEFSIKYKFRNKETDRIVYLFILDLGTEDEMICNPKFENGKLWTFQQIELNLDQNYFSEMFENEYSLLKLIIETRGKYKGV